MGKPDDYKIILYHRGGGLSSRLGWESIRCIHPVSLQKHKLSASVLLESRIIYQLTEAAADRFRVLVGRLKALQQPDARPVMIQKALKIFQGTGYAYYLLQLEAKTGNGLGCVQQAQSILRTVLHCLAVYNQACIDTRKMVQLLELPDLPAGFAGSVERILLTTEPDELLSACERLLETLRDFLLVEQRQILCHRATYPGVFDREYPELKADLLR